MQSSVKYVKDYLCPEELLARLSTLAFSASGTRRLCLHQSDSSPLHVMLVESRHGATFPRHLHSDSDEVTVAVKGSLEVRLWDRGPHCDPREIVLSAEPAGDRFVFVQRDVPHSTRSIGGSGIYLEIKLGPFSKENLVFI